MASEVAATIPPNILETKIGLVCIDVDTTNGVCKTWAVMKQPEPLLPKLSKPELGQLTTSVIGVLILAWVFTVLKKAIN